ncbi:ferritin-like domain-containing protein [Clostridium swellfunianum]|uniref:ferritin-like domain-containing protein n=1 Tax=Clostridium swellfunianum TaxID=1367462 RepID=UPI00202FC6B3|nr:ferritin-like domain-containing protein [Clostridium swellfunianum]MCM0646964.1 ferritin-like domain-containing protein [Clostridium swellfunianum]
MYFGINPEYYEDLYREHLPKRENLLDLIKEAMKDERHDRIKYKNMMEMSKTEKIRKQIEFAYMDEGKHYKMFQQIYYALTGKMIDIPAPQVETYNKLIDAVETSINGELEAVELYRKIQSMLPNMKLRDMLFEIITDEQEHATRFVYVFSILDK